MSSAPAQTFKGWVAHDASVAKGNMKWGDYEPKPFEETDIEIEISHCGVCGTDLHVLSSSWGPSSYPLVVGHEIIGKVSRVGSAVKDLKIGDRSCKRCENGLEAVCKGFIGTYGAEFQTPKGGKSFGGYAKTWRGPGAFAISIPEALPSEIAAPMLCGGVTVYNPLVANGAGPGKRVGVVGIGGLGHFAILFAKALKCDEVVAISRSSSKKEDALKLGADEFIATGEDMNWAANNAYCVDILISTVSGSGFQTDQYLSLLDANGILIQVGAPEDPIPAFNAFSLIMGNRKPGGSMIGSRQQIKDMFELAAKQNIKSWVQVRPMKDANQVLLDFEDGKPRYRYVLQN
ncbi:GroES-like protein [Bimuria novae-zelandiae CBS 107.79]|uniref:alcohol dehydrogenase (NADP(+)) n=1 Tax=Bimuria novae-zelandiae CBS 107.79 TaxID=1447943 RepID=A0A6A5UPE5_9PLEO|nr:GroES-like protein [Bimuria novae-zelandiae CBS 107.79]